MKRTLLVLSLGLFAAGCGDDEDSKKPDPEIIYAKTSPATCATAVAAKKAVEEVAAALPTWSIDDVPSMHTEKTWEDDTQAVHTATPNDTHYAGTYRDDLTTHPGCLPRTAYNGKLFLNSLNEATVSTGIPVQATNASAPGYLAGYPCAAELYDMPAGVTVDDSKPVIILAHGNSSSPDSWNEYKNSALTDQNPNVEGTQLKSASTFEFTVDSAAREMLAAKLLAEGYKVYAADYRTDMTLALANANLYAAPTDPGYGDAIGNVDHGWSVPLLQALIKSVMEAHPNQKVSLIGHSLGTTAIRDALRRLYIDYKEGNSTLNPFAHLKDVVLASGANHGVASGALNCSFYKTMRGSVNCEMGDRGAYTPTEFGKAINGPQDLFATPCADGSFAFGDTNACGGNTVEYTTITMRDVTSGALQDEFVSESAARLNLDVVALDANGKQTVSDAACVDNHLIELGDFDGSGFFMDFPGFAFQGFLANHFGSVRGEAGMKYILDRLADEPRKN